MVIAKRELVATHVDPDRILHSSVPYLCRDQNEKLIKAVPALLALFI